MAVLSQAVTIDTTADVLFASDGGTSMVPQGVIVWNEDAAVTLYLGGPDVSTANGFPVAPESASPAVSLLAGEILYGVVGSGSISTRVLVVGK